MSLDFVDRSSTGIAHQAPYLACTHLPRTAPRACCACISTGPRYRGARTAQVLGTAEHPLAAVLWPLRWQEHCRQVQQDSRGGAPVGEPPLGAARERWAAPPGAHPVSRLDGRMACHHRQPASGQAGVASWRLRPRVENHGLLTVMSPFRLDPPLCRRWSCCAARSRRRTTRSTSTAPTTASTSRWAGQACEQGDLLTT